MSTMQLPFDKLDGERYRSRTLPSRYAGTRERHRLNRILRRRGRVLQAGPDVGSMRSIASLILGTVGPGGTLKTSLLSAADVKSRPPAVHLFGLSTGVLNRLGGDLRWQHLPVPFEVYADGIDLVIFEELGAGAQALHLREHAAREELFRQEPYRRQFRKDYEKKHGPRVWHRDFFDAEIVSCPDGALVGRTFGDVGVERGVHPVDAFLDLVLAHGTALRWRTTISNHRPEYLRRLARSPGIQLGFSDAGAHLRNMAFYNYGLRFLRHVLDAERAGRPFLTPERAVHRLTGEPAAWFGLDAGTLRPGDRADLAVVDPAHLDASLETYAEAPVAQYGGLSRMVNRNDAAVPAVFVAGRRVVDRGEPTPALGSIRAGRFLRCGETDRERRPVTA
jgi:N-acyl-D-aspartate/D-glutamate deacylase